MTKLMDAYNTLLDVYKHQGWWPIDNIYHPKDYSHPKNNKERFEICIGAILTQNTSWNNVEKALANLRRERLLGAKKILSADEKKLASLIKPAGYFNQKTKKLRIFSEFFISLNNRKPTREQLLRLWGIGRETADSILLYAYNKSEFVIDMYTRRFLLENRMFSEEKLNKMTYDDIKSFFEKNIQQDYRLYQEYHALIVMHQKKI